MNAEVDIKQLAIVRDRDQDQQGPGRKRRRHLLSRYFVPGVLVFGFLGLVAWSARDVIVPAHPVWVVPVLASQATVQNEGTPLFQAAGWIEPRPTPVRVPALAPGVVEKLLVVEDQAVKAGEPVAELVKDDARLARDGAAASLKLAEAEVDEARANVDAATAVYNAKQAAEGVVAARMIHEAKSDKEAAKARVAGAEARVEQARVALAEAELRLERMVVRAPIDGRVYQLVGFPGTTLGGMGAPVNMDSSTVVTLYRPDMLQVRSDVRFEDIPKVILGQQVMINNPALQKPIRGKVLYVSSVANIQKNTLGVKIGLDEPVSVFKPEMLVETTYLAPHMEGMAGDESEQMRFYLPAQLVQRDESGTFVWLADQSAGVARKTPVTTGAQASGGLVEIARGVGPGTRIIGRGFEGLKDGQRIRVVSEDAAPAAGEPASGSVEAPAASESHSMHRLP